MGFLPEVVEVLIVILLQFLLMTLSAAIQPLGFVRIDATSHLKEWRLWLPRLTSLFSPELAQSP